jgi:glutamyl-Q tRNA(Asp) synthetase
VTGRVFRFAPSPTGYLHAGHAFSALIAHETAKAVDGRFLLRIEDIDETRCRPEYEAAIYEDLAWLGLTWETPVRRQSDHIAEYRAVIDALAARGLVYRCFKTRREVMEAMASAPHGPEEVFRGGPALDEAARLEAGEPFAWRLSLDAARQELGDAWNSLTFMEAGDGPENGLVRATPDLAGDIVLGRKDVGVAYHLAVVVDDALQGVTDVVRGLDLFEATHIQRLLQALLGLPTPVYLHHRLLMGPDGKRLAKRDKAQTLRELRAAGVMAADLRRKFGL